MSQCTNSIFTFSILADIDTTCEGASRNEQVNDLKRVTKIEKHGTCYGD